MTRIFIPTLLLPIRRHATRNERTSRIGNHRLKTLAVAALLFTTSCARWEHLAERMGDGTRAIYEVRFSTIDDPRHAIPSFDDSRWPATTTYALPDTPVTLWLRTPVVIAPDAFGGRTAGFSVSALAGCDVYWDGAHLGTARNIDNLFVLSPQQAAAGTHILALRVAAPSAGTNTWFYGMGLGDYATMSRSRIVSQVVPMAGLGAFLVVGGWYFAMWLAVRRRPSLLAFSALCFAAALLQIAESYRVLFGYRFEWHLIRLWIVSSLTFAVCLLLPLFFALELQMRRTAVRIAAFAAVLIIIAASGTTYDTACLLMFIHSMIACVAIVVTNIPARRWSLLPTGIGLGFLIAALAAGGFDFGDRTFFIAFAVLIGAILVSLTLDLRREQREHHAATVRAARLEIELLKKSIQPHFVMNTLTAVMEWIESSPADGVKFLESFAEELRIFADVAGRSLIPIGRELELCEAHLRIMSCRNGSRFVLKTEGLRDGDTIPPAIFHTLIENAITHNIYDDEAVAFMLRADRFNGTRRYVFSAPVRGNVREDRGGVGMKYVRTRLEESYPGRWKVDSIAAKGLWQTSIEVPA